MDRGAGAAHQRDPACVPACLLLTDLAVVNGGWVWGWNGGEGLSEGGFVYHSDPVTSCRTTRPFAVETSSAEASSMLTKGGGGVVC